MLDQFVVANKCVEVGQKGSLEAAKERGTQRGGRMVRQIEELRDAVRARAAIDLAGDRNQRKRSEEHTSELQSHHDLVCRLLLEKKKNQNQRERAASTSNKLKRQSPAY